MSRRQKNPLRPLTELESQQLHRLARSGSAPAEQVARAKAVLAVATGCSYLEAARAAGRRSADAVSQLIGRFNQVGVRAVVRRAGQGAKPCYTAVERRRILIEVQRPPEPTRDGTTVWSLRTLQRALQTAPAGLPGVSIGTLRTVLQQSGYRWLGSRTWCQTGQAVRRRRHGVVTVTDPDAEAKKT